MAQSTSKQKQGVVWWGYGLTIFFVIALGCGAAAYTYARTYEGKMYPNVFIGSIPVGGLTPREAREALGANLEPLRQQGLVFVFRSRTVEIPMVAAVTDDPDLSYERIAYDLDGSIGAAFAHARSGAYFAQWMQRGSALFSRTEIFPSFEWKREEIEGILRENLKQFENPAEDAQLRIEGAQVKIVPERKGTAFEYDEALNSALAQLYTVRFAPIPVALTIDTPHIGEKHAQVVVVEAEEFLSGGDAVIAYYEQKWDITRAQLGALLALGQRLREPVDLVISPELLEALLKEDIAAQVERGVQEPKFTFEEGKVLEFIPAQEGRRIDYAQTARLWEDALFSNATTTLALAVETVRPKLTTGEINGLGINELLGAGTSDFAGSPVNRRHNIKIGAEAVNGTLIPPGEEFSLLKTLGEIDAAAGYLPELVIKGNRTIPEYGGGLCQIGTTVFRATLGAGLPVTARTNHSYTVSYYFDDKGLPGTDATIYNPAPDYRFKNDTGNHVLILTRIEGDELIFEFWGTKDGRTAIQSDTRVWDRVSPGPTKFIETLDLPAGVKKCTERAHAGIKAEFDYTITYADGTEDEKTFFSQYRPWQEVCLIGVEELTKDEDTPNTETPLEGADTPAAAIQ